MTSTSRALAAPFPTRLPTVVRARRSRAVPGARALGIGLLTLTCLTIVVVTAAFQQPGLLPYYASGGATLSVLTACVVQLCRIGLGSGNGFTSYGTAVRITTS